MFSKRKGNSKKIVGIFFITFLMLSFVLAAKGKEQNLFFKNGKQKIICLKVEIAKSLKDKQKGLMYRKSLAQDRGMLFVYEKPQYVKFWMKNTMIPLDVGYFDENQELFQIYHMSAYDVTTDFTSSKKAQYALEVNQGWFSKHHIKIGTKFSFEKSKNLSKGKD